MDRPATSFSLRQGVEYGVFALAVVLGWQMVVALFAERAPVDVAVRLAPTSTIALVRAAEAVQAAGRNDDAIELARSALRIAPFNARALSVVGRLQDAAGDPDAADQTLTLAGNWSLRDDPTQAWLVNRRLQQGDYASAFAHAETLVRRESPTQPLLFEMFTMAAEDPRGLSVLVQALSAAPPWRRSYLTFAGQRKDTDQLLAALAVNLQKTPAPLTDVELSAVYRRWLEARQPGAIRAVQQALGRPGIRDGVWNGDFMPGEGVAPLNWSINLNAGFSAQVADTGEAGRGTALLVETDGLASGVVASQLLLLAPGATAIRISQKLETAAREADLVWRITCFETGARLVEWSAGLVADSAWREQTRALTVPTAGCTAQWLQLVARPGGRRMPVRAWFDTVAIAPQHAPLRP